MRDTQHPLFSLFTAITILSNRSYMNCNRFLYQTGKDYILRNQRNQNLKIKIELEFEFIRQVHRMQSE
jgi:hypothetical protein